MFEESEPVGATGFRTIPILSSFFNLFRTGLGVLVHDNDHISRTSRQRGTSCQSPEREHIVFRNALHRENCNGGKVVETYSLAWRLSLEKRVSSVTM